MKFYERVINDFGGYEKCKDILSQPNIGFIMNAQVMRRHMLEYRHQHNIFEVGDKVVSRCADKEIRIFTYQETIGRNILVKCKKGKGYCYPKKWFSHANDAEIKAGKRLEVNDGST